MEHINEPMVINGLMGGQLVQDLSHSNNNEGLSFHLRIGWHKFGLCNAEEGTKLNRSQGVDSRPECKCVFH